MELAIVTSNSSTPNSGIHEVEAVKEGGCARAKARRVDMSPYRHPRLRVLQGQPHLVRENNSVIGDLLHMTKKNKNNWSFLVETKTTPLFPWNDTYKLTLRMAPPET